MGNQENSKNNKNSNYKIKYLRSNVHIKIVELIPGYKFYRTDIFHSFEHRQDYPMFFQNRNNGTTFLLTCKNKKIIK